MIASFLENIAPSGWPWTNSSPWAGPQWLIMAYEIARDFSSTKAHRSPPYAVNKFESRKENQE